jgi:hypothetical protein
VLDLQHWAHIRSLSTKVVIVLYLFLGERTLQLSSQPTREKTLKHEKPSNAWPVCCSAWFSGCSQRETKISLRGFDQRAAT